MNIFVYSDESGVFDKFHNEVFVFGGVIFLSKEDKDLASRKYIRAEKTLRANGEHESKQELKACKITHKEKSKLYRSLNSVIKFGAIIDQKKILDKIMLDKKSKQRYLDFAYKIALKRAFENMIKSKMINSQEVDNLYVFVDEHTTATNGKYELREALEQELKNGTWNFEYQIYYAPVFPNLKSLELKFCNSESTTLVRAADIVANKLYYKAVTKQDSIEQEKLYITKLPN